MYQYFKRQLKTPICFGSFGIHPQGVLNVLDWNYLWCFVCVVGIWQRDIRTCGVCAWCDELRTTFYIIKCISRPIKVIDFKNARWKHEINLLKILDFVQSNWKKTELQNHSITWMENVWANAMSYCAVPCSGNRKQIHLILYMITRVLLPCLVACAAVPLWHTICQLSSLHSPLF